MIAAYGSSAFLEECRQMNEKEVKAGTSKKYEYVMLPFLGEKKTKNWRIRNMKIYNKKTFMSGVFLIVLGVPTLIINILEKDVDVNIVILAVTLSAFGFSSVIRSISCKKTKEDKLDELDERNCLIKLKVQSKSFQITQIVSFVLMFFY